MQRNPEPSNYELLTSLIGLKKDVEYLVLTVNEQRVQMDSMKTKVETLQQFFFRWKGAALALLAVGAIGAWIVEQVINALPYFHK